LPIALRLAQQLENEEFEKWIRLELHGYFNSNPVITEDVVVPKYRTVAGQHSDDFGRPIVITNSELSFVNETRLRFSVAELEQMVSKSEQISTRDPVMTEIIKENLNVVVTIFTFSTKQIPGILSSIKTRLSDYLIEIKPKIESFESEIQIMPNEDVLELKPNIYGIGINLNALKRKWQKFMAKRRNK